MMRVRDLGRIRSWLAGLALAATVMAPPAHAEDYAITITDGGSISVPATLVLVPTIDELNVTNNGINPVDVAIITDPALASPLLGVAGALWFGTNTAFCVLINCTVGASAIDVAFVEFNQAQGQILVTVDGDAFGLPNARLNIFNIYNITTGLTAQIHQILAGQVFIQLSNNGQTVAGRIELLGTDGFNGPGPSSQYFADFTGSLINR